MNAKHHRRAQPALRPLALAWACAALGLAPWVAASAQTLPTGPAVARGQASFVTQGNQLTVTNSANAVVNWQSFSIGAGNAVRFEQPHSSSQVLNRVLGRDPSQIFGRLSSNGTVWLLNPYGVIFGANARVDVGGLVASTLNISDADWQAQRYRLTGGPGLGEAAVLNQGELRTTAGGRLLLVGGAAGVRNEGLMEAPGGQVVLAAGASVDLADSASPQVAVRVSAPQGQVLNLGQLSAASGRIDLQGAMVNQHGIVRADSLAGGQGGEVLLRASGQTELAAGSVTRADGASGGRVVVEGATVLASGAVGAVGSAGGGGRVQFTGAQIGLLDGAVVDASGAGGGGLVTVGGGAMGKDASLPNARAVYMAPGAQVRADATAAGHGGNVILWSDEATRAYGTLSARGGPAGGNGGLIETSGGWLDARPLSISTAAPKGLAGEWLLDPNNITVTASGPDSNVGPAPNFATTNDNATISAASIQAALNAGTNVSLTTGTAGGNSEPGDVTFSGVTLSVSPAVTLTVNAARNIDIVGSSIHGLGGLSVVLNAATGGAGAIGVSGSTISSQGGSIVLSGAGLACGGPGCAPFQGAVALPGRTTAVHVSSSSLSAGAGSIVIRGASPMEGGTGVSISGGSVTARTVEINGWVGANGSADQTGVLISGLVAATRQLGIGGTTVTQGVGNSSATMRGVSLGFGSDVRMMPSSPDTTAALNLTGSASQRSGLVDYAVDVAGDVMATGSSTVNIVGNGNRILLAPNTFNATAAQRFTVGGSGDLRTGTSLSLPAGGQTVLTPSGGVDIADGGLFGPSSGGLIISTAGIFKLGGFGYGASILVGSAPLFVEAQEVQVGLSTSVSMDAGQIQMFAPVIRLGGGANLTATGAGNAIVLSGRSVPSTTFINAGGPSALSTPNGRWLVFGTDPTDSVNFNAGGLPHDFRQYNAGSGTAVQGTGNGLLFSVAATLTPQFNSEGKPSKVYDGTLSAPITVDQISLGGFLPGDSPSGSVGFVNPAFISKNAGVDVPIGASLAGPLPPIFDSSGKPVYGYRYVGAGTGLVGDILPRQVSVTGSRGVDKVYDGTRTADLFGGVFTGVLDGEALTLKTGTALFDTKDVGTGKTVTGTVALADGPNGLAGNYVLTGAGTVQTTASITPRRLSLAGASVLDKVYDGTTTAQVSLGQLGGLVAGETLTVTFGNAQFDTKDAGSNKPVSLQVSITDGTNGGLASNYTLGSGLSAFGNILPRPLTFSGFTAQNKEYDGTRDATLGGGTLTGVLPGETIGFSATGFFDTKDVGQGKAVSAAVSLTNGSGGGLASNYTVPIGGFSSQADITPRALTVTGLTAAPRAYDGTRNATLSGTGTLSGLVSGESLSLTLGAGLFDTKDVGVDKPISASVALADGANGRASNYRLTGGNALQITGTITPKDLTLSSLTAADKVYDGTTRADIQAGVLQGLVAGETLTSTFTGQFDTKDAGTGKQVTAVATLADATGQASNYRLDQSTAVTTASITARPITVGGVTAADKVYDGTTAATLVGSTFTGIVAGESLTLSGQATFDNKNAGTGKRVTGTVALGDGTGGGRAANYVLANPGGFSGTAAITPRGLTVVGATAADKTYDGNTSAQASGFRVNGVIGADQVNVTAGTGTFADPNAGTGKTVTATATALGGADAANYSLAQASVATLASIRPATLTYVANPAIGAFGGPLPSLTGSVAGFVGGDTLQGATAGTLVFTTPAVQGSPEGSYAINGGGLSARNYLFVQAAGNASALTIIPMSTSTLGENTAVQPTPSGLLTTLFPLPLTTSPQAHRALDVLPALLPSPTPAPTPGVAFRTLDFDSMSQDDLAMTLAARERYKKGIFADALTRLEENPTLADLPSCQTVEQAATGDCLITEALKPALRERILREEAAVVAAAPPAAAPTAPAAPPTPATPAAPVATPPAPPPAAAPPLVAVAPPRLPAAAEAELRLPAPRPVVSASLPQIRRKLALVIGTDDYADARIPRLDNAVGDAVAVSEVLERSLGYQAVVVRNGSKSAIVRAFNRLAATVAPEDSVVIYYAGHGELVEKIGLGFWQPADADSQRPETWLSNTDIGKLLGQFSASQVALVSDSCFSGSLVADERIRAGGTLPDPAAVLSRKAAVVMSSGGNEPVFDSGKNGHSTFAWNLMRTLEKVSAWRPGGNVFEQVRFAVAREIPQRPQYGASRLGGHQSGTDYLFEQRQLDARAK